MGTLEPIYWKTERPISWKMCWLCWDLASAESIRHDFTEHAQFLELHGPHIQCRDIAASAFVKNPVSQAAFADYYNIFHYFSNDIEM